MSTVLIVDDNADSVRPLQVALEHRSHAVVLAADGVEALELAGRHAESLALLVVEFATPGLAGAELARAFGSLRPRVPVLFVSAERAPRDLGDLVVGRPAAFLAKPLSTEELRRTVADLTT